MNKELELAVRRELQIDDDIEIVVIHEDYEYEIGEGEYIIVTEEKAIELAKIDMKESLWAFNPTFLEYETGIDRVVFEALAENGQCESNNRAIESLIEVSDITLDELYNSAIEEDGLGLFLAQYDSEERDLDYEDYLMYRIN